MLNVFNFQLFDFIFSHVCLDQQGPVESLTLETS